MRRTVTTDAKIEAVEIFGSSVVFTCTTPRRRQFTTTVTYNDRAPRHSLPFQKWRLLRSMADAYGITLDPAWPALYGLIGCFFRFRLVEWKGNWLIDKFRRCDPFEVSDGIAELEAYLKEAGDEVL